MKLTLLACRSALLRKELRHRAQSFRVGRYENERLPEAYDSALQEQRDEDSIEII